MSMEHYGQTKEFADTLGYINQVDICSFKLYGLLVEEPLPKRSLEMVCSATRRTQGKRKALPPRW